METKKRKNPYSAFKKLTIANTTIAWFEFVYVFALTIFAALKWAHTKLIEPVQIPRNYELAIHFGTILILANIALAIAQSVFAKRIGKITNKIGFEQIICILIVFIGFAFIFGDVGVYCGSQITPVAEWIKNPAIDTHWLLYIATACFGACALLMGGFAAYNTVLVSKVKVFKAKKA